MGAAVWPQLAGLHPQPQLGQAAVTEVGALGTPRTARQLAVEEDRNAEPADLVGDLDRLDTGSAALGRVEPDDRAHVKRPDCRVDALVRAHVDLLDRLLGAPDEGVEQRPRLGGERKDRAVVLGI